METDNLETGNRETEERVQCPYCDRFYASLKSILDHKKRCKAYDLFCKQYFGPMAISVKAEDWVLALPAGAWVAWMDGELKSQPARFTVELRTAAMSNGSWERIKRDSDHALTVVLGLLAKRGLDRAAALEAV